MSTSSKVRAALGGDAPKNTSAPRSKRSKREEHTCAGLCAECQWNPARVPEPWFAQRPGTPYAAPSPLIGRTVTLRGDDRPSTVVSVATPLGESIFQHGRRSRRYKCGRSFILRTPFGRGYIETAVPGAVVRERLRAPTREGNCPDAVDMGASRMKGYTQAIERDALRAGVHPHDYVGLEPPFPHRKGSSPCCGSSSRSPEKLDRMLAAWLDSGEESDFATLEREVRRAMPKHMRATAFLQTRADVEAAIKSIRDHCWTQWLEYEARVTEPSKTFQKRVKAARKAMTAAGLDGRSMRARKLHAALASGVEQDAVDAGELAATIEAFLRGPAPGALDF